MSIARVMYSRLCQISEDGRQMLVVIFTATTPINVDFIWVQCIVFAQFSQHGRVFCIKNNIMQGKSLHFIQKFKN